MKRYDFIFFIKHKHTIPFLILITARLNLTLLILKALLTFKLKNPNLFMKKMLLLFCLACSIASAQTPDSVHIKANYEKMEVVILMSYGWKLFSSIYLKYD